MRNVTTQVYGTAFDIAIEKAGTNNKEVRYDVASLQMVDAHTAKITTAKGGASYTLKATAPQNRPGTPALTDDQALARLGATNFVRLAKGQGGIYSGQWFANLTAYQQSYATPGSVDAAALAVVRISPRLASALGFVPAAAYLTSGRQTVAARRRW